MSDMNLADLLARSSMFVEGKVFVEIINRDSEGCVVSSVQVPIRMVKADFDRKGVGIRVEQGDIDCALRQPKDHEGRHRLPTEAHP